MVTEMNNQDFTYTCNIAMANILRIVATPAHNQQARNGKYITDSCNSHPQPTSENLRSDYEQTLKAFESHGSGPSIFH